VSSSSGGRKRILTHLQRGNIFLSFMCKANNSLQNVFRQKNNFFHLLKIFGGLGPMGKTPLIMDRLTGKRKALVLPPLCNAISLSVTRCIIFYELQCLTTLNKKNCALNEFIQVQTLIYGINVNHLLCRLCYQLFVNATHAWRRITK